ncbi:LysR family transcriptional regulator [Roseateles sp. DAIF2]|uniref:LysR substrate-binding domain-containing protein n=1 Tax=Roseateles sp. DAIF2 TaxID=2714952 RepID=UPI0018A2EF03|nr:LysR substrate-binding domain-containing protein [Roseateles sp. DAIF2]QPF73887.1 LysR family transcriptional regulator [Roseateles sp. DAIF2]
MSRLDLPPLHALQAFEAAARLGSFSAAAAERHLTHSAVSRAVALVEHGCGEALFTRSGPRIRLTPAGQALLARLAEPLHALHAALHGPQQASADAAPQPLAIHTLPSFAQTWLLPRLQDFIERHPAIVLSLQVGYTPVSLPPLEPAVALRFGQFERSGLQSWLLWRDMLVAVATPRWVEARGRDPGAWPGRQLLRLAGQPWPRRLEGARLEPPAALECADALLVLHAALRGLGVAWLRRSLVEPWLSSGELMCLSSQAAGATDKAMWMACRQELAEKPAVRAFTDWIEQQVAQGPL